MKRLFPLFALMLLLASCHTNENNYREAYDKAVNRTRETLGEDMYNQIVRERTRNTAMVDGDSIRLIPEHVNPVDTVATVVKNYSVVVGEFKQKFNAKSYAEEIARSSKLPTYVLFTADQDYLVVAQGFDEIDEAAAFLKEVDKRVKLKILTLKPWILRKI